MEIFLKIIKRFWRCDDKMLSLTNRRTFWKLNVKDLVGHLRSADFFNVENFPTAKLSIKNSKILEKLEDGRYKMLLDGSMTVKGKTNPVSFESIINLDSDIKTAEGKLIFDRNDFEIQYSSEMHI